jgi:hypothetical protein
MIDNGRVRWVRELLTEYVKSPSLRHLRDDHSLNRLASEIIRKLDRTNPVWRKWNEPREAVLLSAIKCWIPIDEMRDYLNEIEGLRLTSTDVSQRLREFQEQPFTEYPKEELQQGCLMLFEKEKAAGTELPAIIGALQEYIEQEEQRLYEEKQARWRARAAEEQEALEQRLLSGADCKWTSIKKSTELYCRINGRTYRLSPTKDKMWNLHRKQSMTDSDGALVGRYRARGDATKALKQIAYQPEPKW